MVNYLYDCYRILNKVYSEGSFLKQAINSVDIQESNRALTVKTCYGVLDNDIRLSYYISQMSEKTPKLAIRTLLKIAMYCIEFLEKHAYAIIDNTVELIKKLGKGGASGFVNAILRRFAKNIPQLPQDYIQRLSVQYSYPEFAVKQLINDYGQQLTKEILSSKGGKTFVRFNKINGEEYLKERNITFRDTGFDNLYECANFVRNDDFDLGLYTFQSVGSVAICSVVEGGDKLIDCCAAPGGKSVLLADRFNEVVSCDIHDHRLQLIESYATRMKKDNIKVVRNDASILNEQFINAFDGVLCDVPCSGYGVVNDNPDIKISGKEKDVISLSKLQLQILSTCSKYVKIGGYIYYSTCSIFSRENIEIIKQFMSDRTDFELVEIDSKLPHIKVDGCLQFLPNISSGCGFFVAKIKRVK